MKPALVVLAIVCTGGPLVGNTAVQSPAATTLAQPALLSFELSEKPLVTVPARLLDAPVQSPLPADRVRPAEELPKPELPKPAFRAMRDYPPSPWDSYLRGDYHNTPAIAVPLSAPGVPRW